MFQTGTKWTCYNSWVYSKSCLFLGPALGSGKTPGWAFLQLSGPTVELTKSLHGRCLMLRTSEHPLDEGFFSCDFWASKAQHFFSANKKLSLGSSIKHPR